MSQSEIGIGTQVVCINDAWAEITGPFVLRVPYLNEILSVREIRKPPSDSSLAGLIFLLFDEIVNPPDPAHIWGSAYAEVGFVSTSFRPCRKTDLSVFTRYLVEIEDKVVA